MKEVCEECLECGKCKLNGKKPVFLKAMFEMFMIAEEELLKFYEYYNVTEVAEVCLKNGIHPDEFFYQIIFEFWYGIYIESSERSIAFNKFSGDASDENIRKWATRQVDKSTENKKEVIKSLDIDQEFIDVYGNENPKKLKKYYADQLSYILDSCSIHKHDEYGESENQLKQRKSIFWKIADGTVAKSKNYLEFELEQDLNQFELVYEYIEKSGNTYFEKCIQYYQLEKEYRYETYYRLCKELKQNKVQGEEKKWHLEYFKSFYMNICDLSEIPGMIEFSNIMQYKVIKMQNNFIKGLDAFYSQYRDKPQKIKTIPFNIIKLNIFRKIILDKLKEKSEEYKDFHILSCPNAERIFKNHLGEGQHIQKDKNIYADIDLRDFRTLYKPMEF